MGRLCLTILLLPITLFAQEDQLLYQRYKPNQHEWSYSGPFGPSHWADLDDEYRACDGTLQSPVNLVDGDCFETSLDLTLNYRPFLVDLVNNGHTLIENVVESKALILNDVDYTLIQFHFHTPSEHRINGEGYQMEIHFVHQSQDGQYLVFAVLVDEGEEDNPFLAHFYQALPKHVNEEIRSLEKASVPELFSDQELSFYYYTGSLTTPPCTEGVHWIVLDQPVKASHQQLEAIHEIIRDDNRPVQNINDRQLIHSTSRIQIL